MAECVDKESEVDMKVTRNQLPNDTQRNSDGESGLQLQTRIESPELLKAQNSQILKESFVDR